MVSDLAPGGGVGWLGGNEENEPSLDQRFCHLNVS